MKFMRSGCLLTLLSALLSPAIHAADAPPPRYTGDFAVGLSLTKGNSDTSNFNLAFNMVDDPKTKNVLKYDAFYLRAASDGGLTVDRTSFGARDEYTLSPLTYAFGDAHFLRDKFKKIDYLLSPVAGAGHHFVKTDVVDLAGEIGVGAVVESDSGRGRTTSGALQARELYQRKLSATSTFAQTASALWKAGSFGDALYHFDAALASALTRRSQLKVSLLDDFKTRPPDPSVKKNDVSLLAALVFKF
jgi:putative salt-induced outer membrane protein YdiY